LLESGVKRVIKANPVTRKAQAMQFIVRKRLVLVMIKPAITADRGTIAIPGRMAIEAARRESPRLTRNFDGVY
jgi:hypothetical protein